MGQRKTPWWFIALLAEVFGTLFKTKRGGKRNKDFF